MKPVKLDAKFTRHRHEHPETQEATGENKWGDTKVRVDGEYNIHIELWDGDRWIQFERVDGKITSIEGMHQVSCRCNQLELSVAFLAWIMLCDKHESCPSAFYKEMKLTKEEWDKIKYSIITTIIEKVSKCPIRTVLHNAEQLGARETIRKYLR